MNKFAVFISLLALVIAILAYQKAGGTRDLDQQMRTLQKAVETARQETADALSRLEKALRPADQR